MKANLEKGTKICSKCKRELPIEMFQRDKSKSDGFNTQCKECVSLRTKSKEGKEVAKRARQKYYQTEKGKECQRRSTKNYQQTEAGKETYRKATKKYNQSEHGKLHNEEYRKSEAYKIKQYIENQFVDGMSWDNQDKWYIDHIIPCAAFDLTDPIHQRICFNWRNLQPLWAEDNLSKNDSLPEGWQDLLEEIRTALNIDEVVELKKE